MSTIDRITDLISRAELAEEVLSVGLLNAARDLLAETAMAGEKLDEERLMVLLQRCSTNSGDHTTPKQLIRWGNFMGCLADFMREGVVGMKDGRLATPDGWDYTNCEPDDLHSNISRLQSERLQAYISTLTDAEASNDPDRNPSEYDEKFDEAVDQAIAQYLNSKGFPQLWQRNGS